MQHRRTQGVHVPSKKQGAHYFGKQSARHFASKQQKHVEAQHDDDDN